MKTFSMTDKGRTRETNQDFVFSSEKPVGNLQNLFIVADGMGGHNAGDYASRYAIEIIVKEIMECRGKEPAAIFGRAIAQANAALVKKAAEDVQLYGMGTTAVLATLEGNSLWVANIGDSRLYLLGEEGIRQVTRDHSLVEEMVLRGELRKSEARMHPDKNIITRAIGATEDVTADMFEVEIQQDEQILMCTDGLTNMVEDEEVLAIVRGREDLVERVEKLVERANENGGKDNITVIMIEPFLGEV